MLAYFLIFLAVVGFVITIIIIAKQIEEGKIKLTETYSYREVFKSASFFLIIAILLCSLLYLKSKSIEASLSLFVFLLAIIIAACLRTLFTEYHIKKRAERLK